MYCNIERGGSPGDLAVAKCLTSNAAGSWQGTWEPSLSSAESAAAWAPASGSRATRWSLAGLSSMVEGPAAPSRAGLGGSPNKSLSGRLAARLGAGAGVSAAGDLACPLACAVAAETATPACASREPEGPVAVRPVTAQLSAKSLGAVFGFATACRVPTILKKN